MPAAITMTLIRLTAGGSDLSFDLSLVLSTTPTPIAQGCLHTANAASSGDVLDARLAAFVFSQMVRNPRFAAPTRRIGQKGSITFSGAARVRQRDGRLVFKFTNQALNLTRHDPADAWAV
jgi:hypothetical protein